MDLLLANPRGFCAGVDRAIEIVASVHELRGVSEDVVFPLPEALNSDATTRCPSAQPMKTFVSLGPTSPWNMACNGER
jgi:hypothetical protein